MTKHTGAMRDDRLKIGADREAGTGVGIVHLSFRLGVSCFTRARVQPAPSARLSPARLDQYGTRALGSVRHPRAWISTAPARLDQYDFWRSVRQFLLAKPQNPHWLPKPSLVAKTLTGCHNSHWSTGGLIMGLSKFCGGESGRCAIIGAHPALTAT